MGSNARRPFGTTRAGGARGHSDDTSRTPAVAVAWLRTATASLALLTAAACSAQEPELLSVARHPSTATTVGFGAFTYGGVWQGMEPVLRLEAELGRRLDVVHWFTNWDNDYYPEMVEAVTAGGRAPLISWQPHRQGVRDIAAGVYDDYVRAWARGVADAPGVVYLRPFPEMNGDWVPWNGDPDGLKAAWRHVAAIFAAEGADNVRWVFSPNVTDEPRVNDNRMEQYYPGDDVVDVLALSGYNWGATRPYIGWRSFEEIFHTAYPRITALGPQPLWLAEIASSDEGGDKAAWVRDMFASTVFPRLEMVVWFDEDKEADWRVTSHPEVVQAFRDAFDSAEVSASLR
jgi:mannan endo-1,4-beta-mannosidase